MKLLTKGQVLVRLCDVVEKTGGHLSLQRGCICSVAPWLSGEEAQSSTTPIVDAAIIDFIEQAVKEKIEKEKGK